MNETEKQIPPANTTPNFIDEKQLLARLPVSRRTLFSWRTTGKISDVTRYGLITSSLPGTFDQFPSRGQYQVQRGDVLVAINNSSRGTVVLVPNQFHGAICTSGFLVIRPSSKEEGLLLWYALRSEVCRKQIYYLAQTASQPEIKMGEWRERFLIPMPKGKSREIALTESRHFQLHLDSLLDADKCRFLI
jgi:hypothetical protein